MEMLETAEFEIPRPSAVAITPTMPLPTRRPARRPIGSILTPLRCALLFILLEGMDFVETLLLLRLGARERNPGAAPLLATHSGQLLVALIKLGGAGLLSAMLLACVRYLVPELRPTAWRTLFGPALLVALLVVLWNTAQLLLWLTGH